MAVEKEFTLPSEVKIHNLKMDFQQIVYRGFDLYALKQRRMSKAGGEQTF